MSLVQATPSEPWWWCCGSVFKWILCGAAICTLLVAVFYFFSSADTKYHRTRLVVNMPASMQRHKTTYNRPTDLQPSHTHYIQQTRTSHRQWFFYAYHRMHIIYLFSLQASRSRVCITISIGQSSEGRPILASKCGSGPRVVIIEGGIHGREWISTAVVTYIINELSAKPDIYHELLSQYTFYCVPILNPDGYEYTFTHNRFWRKSRSVNNGDKCKGSDLNRNFHSHWSKAGTSTDPCSEIYHGRCAGCEPEVQAMSRLILHHRGNISIYLALHSYKQLFLVPYAFTSTPHPQLAEFLRIARAGRDALQEAGGPRFKVGMLHELIESASGNSMDYAVGVGAAKFAVTIELRDNGTYGFQLPASQILQSGEETMSALLAMLNSLGSGS